MAELRGPFLDEGELVLGEYAFSEGELNYLRDTPKEEACRALVDMGAAAVFIDNLSFSDMELTIGSFETIPLELTDGDVIKYPGRYVSWGIRAAQQSQKLGWLGRRKALKVMTEMGLTAHTGKS